jgi:hypothetical protein
MIRWVGLAILLTFGLLGCGKRGEPTAETAKRLLKVRLGSRKSRTTG